MLTTTALALFYLLVSTVLIYRFRLLQIHGLKKWLSIFLFVCKCLAGIGLWYVYTYHYTDTRNNDAHKFFNDALVLQQIRIENKDAFNHLMFGTERIDEQEKYNSRLLNWERNFDEAPINENRTAIRFNALLMFITAKSYFAHIIILCFLSYAGLVWMVNTIFSSAANENRLLAYLVMLLPSVLFWNSGVMKEPILVFGLGIFVAALTGLNSAPLKNGLLLLIGCLILLSIKFYVLLCLAPAALAYIVFNNKLSPIFQPIKYVVVYLLLLAIAFNLQHISRYDLPQMLANKQEHAIKEAAYFNAGSRINIPVITSDAASIISAAPIAVFNTLMRPFVTEGKNALMLISALENLLVLILVLFCIRHYRAYKQQQLNLLLFLLAATVGYFALIGICTPVIGNLVRYKAPLLPLFQFAFILATQVPLLPAKLQRFLLD